MIYCIVVYGLGKSFLFVVERESDEHDGHI